MDRVWIWDRVLPLCCVVWGFLPDGDDTECHGRSRPLAAACGSMGGAIVPALDLAMDGVDGMLDLGSVGRRLLEMGLQWLPILGFFSGCHGSEVEFFVVAWTAAGGQGLRDLDGSRCEPGVCL
ncbi:hypothetical protein ACLOJK_037171 [Asimina triloba]